MASASASTVACTAGAWTRITWGDIAAWTLEGRASGRRRTGVIRACGGRESSRESTPSSALASFSWTPPRKLFASPSTLTSSPLTGNTQPSPTLLVPSSRTRRSFASIPVSARCWHCLPSILPAIATTTRRLKRLTRNYPTTSSPIPSTGRRQGCIPPTSTFPNPWTIRTTPNRPRRAKRASLLRPPTGAPPRRSSPVTSR
mmetsp:Transcript_33411/g.71197  ORF Transcript_33411/g.71197 Transcript_33411/m.71197 type:complete len:201 (-) Transcript_33411:4794-5396(-)